MLVRKILKPGVLTYMPTIIQKTFLKRSLFDFLCDLWFMQSLTNLIKLIIAPMYLQMTPEGKILIKIIGVS